MTSANTHQYDFLVQDILEHNFSMHLRGLALAWTETIIQVAREPGKRLPFALHFNPDWIRDGAMAAVQLGLPMRPDFVLRLLSDHEYFKSLIPIPVDDS